VTLQPAGPNGHVFIVSAARTPIGKFAGALSTTPATERKANKNYSTDVVLTVGDKTVEYSGQGSCYAAATVFTFGLTMANGDNLGFSVPMDVGRHPIDRRDTALYLRHEGLDVQPDNGSITVNHWNVRDRADGELAATGPSISVRGHWSCRFDSH